MAERRGGVVGGIVMIVLGAALLVAQYIPDAGIGLFLASIGVVFLVAHFLTKTYGLLVPGCLLAGLGAGLVMEQLNVDFAEPVVLGLGAGFLLIFLIDKLITRRGPASGGFWPLIPGGILLAVAILESIESAVDVAEIGLPTLVILAGVWVVVRALWPRKEKEPAYPTQGEGTVISGQPEWPTTTPATEEVAPEAPAAVDSEAAESDSGGQAED